MMIATMFTASLRSGVNASGDVSCITPKICHASRNPERAYPISPIKEVNVIATRINTYWERFRHLPPFDSARCCRLAVHENINDCDDCHHRECNQDLIRRQDIDPQICRDGKSNDADNHDGDGRQEEEQQRSQCCQSFSNSP